MFFLKRTSGSRLYRGLPMLHPLTLLPRATHHFLPLLGLTLLVEAAPGCQPSTDEAHSDTSDSSDLTDGDSECDDDVVESGETCDDDQQSLCGNGVVEPGEMCDDGDGLNGDGCNVDCVASGTMRWAFTDNAYEHGQESALAVAVLPDDSFVVATFSEGELAESLRCFSAEGLSRWSMPIGSGVYPRKMAYSEVSGVIVVIGQAEFGVGEPGVWITGVDPDGTKLWEHTYPDHGYADALGVVALSDGEFLIAAKSPDWLRGYDADGHEQWSIEGYSDGHLESIAAHPQGGFIVTGMDDSTGGIWLHRYDADHELLWARERPDLHSTSAAEIAEDGTIYLSGRNQRQDAPWLPERLPWLLSLSPEGDQRWLLDYVPEHHDSGSVDAVIEDLTSVPGGLIFAGGQSTDVAPSIGILVGHYSTEGTLKWAHHVGSSVSPATWVYPRASAVTIDNHGDIIAVGSFATEHGSEIWIGRFAP